MCRRVLWGQHNRFIENKYGVLLQDVALKAVEPPAPEVAKSRPPAPAAKAARPTSFTSWIRGRSGSQDSEAAAQVNQSPTVWHLWQLRILKRGLISLKSCAELIKRLCTIVMCEELDWQLRYHSDVTS